MAGDWMQIDLDLPEKPEVLQLCAETGMEKYAIVGRLVAFWRWVERMGVDGRIKHATRSVVASVVDADDKFVSVLTKVEWVAFDDTGATIPNWERRFSKAAKQRMEDAKRKQAGRKQDARPKVSDASPKTTGTKEERDKENTTTPQAPPPVRRGGDSALNQTWKGVEADLLSLGVGGATKACLAAQSAGCSVDDAMNVIGHWRLKRPAWGEAALYNRILNLRPGQECSELWPPVSGEFAMAEGRAAVSRSHDKVVQERHAGEERRRADEKERQRLEDTHGKVLDAMDRKKVREFIRERFPDNPAFYEKLMPSRGSPVGILRAALLSELDSAPKEPTLVLEPR